MLLNERDKDEGKWKLVYSRPRWLRLVPSWWQVLGGSAIFIVTIFLGTYMMSRDMKAAEKDLSENGRYTIGYATGEFFKRRQRYINFHYSVGGRRFDASGYVKRNMKIMLEQGKYYVKYSSLNPGNSIMLFDKPVVKIDSLAPGCWEQMPE